MSNKHSHSTPDSQNYQYQEHLGAFTPDTGSTASTSFAEPPIPPQQHELELLNPMDTLDVLRDPDSDVRQWLTYMEQQYTPPDDADVLLLYPCAAEKPMPGSKTYRALADTLSQFTTEQQRRVHVVTISEPMGPIPYEFQDGDTWLYDCPGLFQWWCANNDKPWDDHAQQQCLQILGEHTAGFIDRAVTNDWYDEHIACVRHVTAKLNTSSDQTHRQMLEIVEAITDTELTWLPSEQTVESLVESVGTMAWQMMGVSHATIQTELATTLEHALDPE